MSPDVVGAHVVSIVANGTGASPVSSVSGTLLNWTLTLWRAAGLIPAVFGRRGQAPPLAGRMRTALNDALRTQRR